MQHQGMKTTATFQNIAAVFINGNGILRNTAGVSKNSDLVLRIRNIFPDAAITTDIMVGFAGESDEEFEKSLEFVKKMGFARSHIFIYSRRTGTVAAALKNQIPQKTEAFSRSPRFFVCMFSFSTRYVVWSAVQSDMYLLNCSEMYFRNV